MPLETKFDPFNGKERALAEAAKEVARLTDVDFDLARALTEGIFEVMKAEDNRRSIHYTL